MGGKGHAQTLFLVQDMLYIKASVSVVCQQRRLLTKLPLVLAVALIGGT